MHVHDLTTAPRARRAGPARRTVALLVSLTATLAGVLVLLAPSAGAVAISPTGGTTAQPAFGALLDWSSPSAAQDYARSLGGTPGVYGQTLGYPLTSAGTAELDTVARASAARGAAVLLELDPTQPLLRLDADDAGALVSALQNDVTRYHSRFLVDFAPEMNGSWQPWGQQPDAYVAAFRAIAAAVHSGVPSARTVWEPSNGAGYPFGGVRGSVAPSGPRVVSQLDTDGNGRVDARDDPYRPYWPGRSYVDQVGLTDFWYGPAAHLGTNALPSPGFFAASLRGAVGYKTATGQGRDFVKLYSQDLHLPLLVETAALYVTTQASGPSREAILRDWLGQVFAPSVRKDVPTLSDVVWLETDRPEAEAGGATVAWRSTSTPAFAALTRSAVRGAGYRLGPVPAVGGRTQASAAAAEAYEPPVAGSSGTDRILGSIATLLVLFLAAGLAGRFVPSWRYREAPAQQTAPGTRVLGPVTIIDKRVAAAAAPAGSTRDRRIDLLRGFVIAAVVVVHLGLGGPWSWFVARAGALTGAEMFVLLSGIVLGMLYPLTEARRGRYVAAVTMVRRAFRLYLGTLAVVLAVFALSKLPGVNATAVTTFTDRGTGTGGEAAAGRVYYLYGTAQHLLAYPPPWFAIKDLLLLRYGPWPINIMGLFVVLSLAVPAAMWLVRHRLWWLLLAVSWGLYVLNALHPVRLFDAEFEAVFPLLSWQVAFTHGLVIGRYRTRIVAALTSLAGRIAVTATMVAFLAGLLVLHAGVHLPGVPSYAMLYPRWFSRTDLDGGRLVDLALSLVVVYALLTTCWRPLHATLGRVFEPLGRHSLAVFFVQVFVVLAVGNIPHLSQTVWWQGFAVQTVALALIWLAMRRLDGPFRRRPADPSAPAAAKQPAPELVRT